MNAKKLTNRDLDLFFKMVEEEKNETGSKYYWICDCPEGYILNVSRCDKCGMKVTFKGAFHMPVRGNLGRKLSPHRN